MKSVDYLKVTVLLLAAITGLLHCGEDEEPQYGKALIDGLNQGKIEQVKGDFSAVHNALNAYQIDHGSYPGGDTFEEVARQLSPAYINYVKTSDPWGSPYVFSTDGGSYTLISYGIDKIGGTADDFVFTDGSFEKVPQRIFRGRTR